MSSKIWRFSYTEDSLKSIIDSGVLQFPEIIPHPSAKHNSKDKIIADMRIGCFIVLANFNSLGNVGTIRAAGLVTEIANDSVRVSWKKLVPSISLHPHKIGAEQWLKENVFLFNAPRAKEFKLDALKKKLFP